jgi:hypothetical protein
MEDRQRARRPDGGLVREPLCGSASYRLKHAANSSRMRSMMCCASATASGDGTLAEGVVPGDGWRYCFRGVLVGDSHRPAGKSLRAARGEVGVLPGIWKGRDLTAVGLTAGEPFSRRSPEAEGRWPGRAPLLEVGLDRCEERKQQAAPVAEPAEDGALSDTCVLDGDGARRLEGVRCAGP